MDQKEFPTGVPLLYDSSFWGLTITQFLGAFNDNLYKQLILLLAVASFASVASVENVANVENTSNVENVERVEKAASEDTQGWATFVFSLPFVFLSGFAGYLSDRFSKAKIIVLCKAAEIGVMILGVMAFLFYDQYGFWGTWTVLFLMGSHSAFFGPGKYGILPELFQSKDLARANGIILMTTFLAIIFGSVIGGALKDWLVTEDGSARRMWMGIMVCVGIAIVGTLTSLVIRRVPPAQPKAKLTADCLAISREIFTLLRTDTLLLKALMVSCVFWLVSGIAVPTVNRLGLSLGVDATHTSYLSASIALGIMIGALLSGWLCRLGHSDRLVTVGLWGIFGSLLALGCWTAGDKHLLGYGGSIVALVVLGVFAAIYAIPLQVFLQDRPPANLKGRMIATMNQANFIGILISGPLYQLFEAISSWLKIPISSVFWMMSVLVLVPAIFYRLDSSVLATDEK